MIRSLGRWVVGLSMVAVACGEDGPSSPGAASGPVPAEMCEAGEEPALAAYDRETGEYKWSLCSTDPVRRYVAGVFDDTVHLGSVDAATGRTTTVAYSVADGSEVSAAEVPPSSVPQPTFSPENLASIEVDGVRIEGGQDDATTAFDVATGDQLWTRPGSLVYDDVWAVGEGAVYVVERSSTPDPPRVVAYDIGSGDVRWERSMIGPAGDELWPWAVRGDDLFAMWTNLEVMSTDDGSTKWRTEYPAAPFPRMTGVDATNDTVLVAFSSIPSGGD